MKLSTFLFAFMIMFLASCGTFKDDPTVSIWAGQLWILPWVAGIGAGVCAFFIVRSYILYKVWGNTWLKFAFVFALGVLATIIIVQLGER